MFFVYLASLSVPMYVDDSVVLSQAYNIKDIPFDFFNWLQLRYVGLKSFYLSDLFGQDLRVVHLVSIFIHLLNGICIYLILKQVSFNKWGAFFIVGLWLIHPLNSQAVIYMSQRFTLVSTLFLLVSVNLLLYMKNSAFSLYRYKSYIINLVLLFSALLFFIMSLLSKQSVAFLPIYVAFYLIFFSPKRKLASLITIGVLILIAAILYINGDLLAKLDSLTRETSSYSRLDYFSTQLKVVLIYLSKVIVPINFTLESSIQIITFNSSEFYKFLFIHLAIILFVGGVYKYKKDSRLLIALSFFYFSMVVESSFIPIQDLYFEHRMYLPSAAALTVITLTLSYVLPLILKIKINKKFVFIPAFILLSYLTYNRVLLWQEPLLFYKNEYAQNPMSTRAMSSYGKELAKNGEHDKALELLLRSFNSELKQGIVRQATLVGLLTVLIDLNYYQDALNLGQRAIKLTQSRPKLQALVYAHLALVYFEMKQCGFAKGWSKKALSLDSSVTLAKQLIYLCGNTK